MSKKLTTEEFIEKSKKEFGSYIRGAKAISKPTQRGYATFAFQKPVVVLLEPFFCTRWILYK